MAPHLRFVTLALAVVTALVPTRAISQETATSFVELAKVLKPGDVVRVSVAGDASIRGTVEKLSASSIELAPVGRWRAGRDRRILSEADVRSIQVDRGDSVWDGALIGLAVGGAVGLIGGAASCGNSSCQAGPVALAFGALFGGIGAGAGALTDVAIRKRVTIYESSRARQTVTRIAPFVGNQGTGIQVSMGF